jgi:hypothetical protein
LGTGGDGRLFSRVDTYHAPESMTVVNFDMFRPMSPASDRAWEAFGMPRRGAWRRINGYVYGASFRAMDDATEPGRRVARSQELLRRAMRQHEEMWRGTLVPKGAVFRAVGLESRDQIVD